MLNHITIMGRLVRDPEMRRTGSGTNVANFTLAVDRDFADKQSGQKETDFIECVAWKHTADFVGEYFTKGKMAAVSGRLQSRKWTDKNGGNRTSWEVQAENVYFAESKQSSGGSAYASPAPAAQTNYPGMEDYPETAALIAQAQGRPADFSYPYPGKQSDYALLEDDDGQLPF